MPAIWSISHWPVCEYHVFLSHCAEDLEQLVIPVYRRLQQANITPWIDHHDYPSGRDPFEALRENLLRCQHIVYFITPAMLRQPRGWTTAEKTYGALIQQILRFGAFDVSAVELPLFLMKRTDPRLPRSVWRTLLDRGRFIPARAHRVAWAVAEIERFLRQEQRVGEQMSVVIGRHPELSRHFGDDENLLARISGTSPPPVYLG